MNNSINGSAAMTPDATMAQSNGFGNDAWASISPYSQSPYSNSPMNEYANWSSYMPHGLPTEPIRMQPPPPQAPTHQLIQPAPAPSQAAALNHHHSHHQQHQQHQQHQHQHQHHHPQLPMLNTQWPSQLTNPTPTQSYSAPPLSMTPVSAPATTPSAPPTALGLETPRSLAAPPPPPPPPPAEKARKTLSTEQKRAMCLYYEENPGTRQADIGAKFGVERSTVSKVLRQKDQLLKRDQEPDHIAAMKRGGKGKHPDFDRTLSNYIRRQQQSGFEVKDEEIMDQAKLFARASGNQDSLLNSLTSSWLQKFKQKHGIGAGGRLMRRASETNIPDSARMSTVRRPSVKKEKRKNSVASAVKAAPTVTTGLGIGIISPASPTGQMSPLSETKSEEAGDSHATDAFDLDLDFTYRQNASQSTTSLTTDLRDATNPGSSFSGGTLSPAGTLTFSPDPNVGGFAVDQNLNPRNGIPDFHQHQQQQQQQQQQHQLHREKRSNTFPSLSIDSATTANNMTPSLSHQQMTPRHQLATAPSSALESPDQEIPAPPFGLDTTLGSPPKLRRSGSNSSIAAARSAANTPAPNSAVTATSIESASSPPISPSQEDARRAANTLLSYIQSASSIGQFDSNEYMAIVQLTKKLQMHQLQHPQPQHRPSIGGLSRIPEGDTEMIQAPEMLMETS